MAIPTSRTAESPEIHIDDERCTGCGLCVSACSDLSLSMKDGRAVRADTSVFGCIGCGHCMAICPADAIRVSGRELSPDDLFPLPDKSGCAGYGELLSLLQRRRSIRTFSDDAVAPELIEKIIEAALTAPMGLPPSDVNVLVFDSREKTRRFAEDFSRYLKGMSYMTNPLFLALMRPFWGREMDALCKGFLRPLFRAYTTDGLDRGVNTINYDAPLAMYFYGSPFSDPADPVVAATYAMIAAHALGLGTCMLGAVHPFIQHGRKAAAFRKQHGIRYKSREGLFVIFGTPRTTYRKGIKRTFASVLYHQ